MTRGVWLGLLAGVAAACSLFTSLDDLAPPISSIPDASGDSFVLVDAAPDVPACVADLTKDPKNCGSCGHDCCGGDCMTGVCQPRVMASQQTDPAWVIVLGQTVYWELNSFSMVSKPPFPPPATTIRSASITGAPNPTDFIVNRRIERSDGIQTDGKSIFWVEFDQSANPPFQMARANPNPTADAGYDLQRAGLFNAATQFGFFNGFVVGAQAVYWFATSSSDCAGGGFKPCLFRASTSDVSQRQVVYPYSIGGGSTLTADNGYVYFGPNNEISRVDTVSDAGISNIAPAIQRAGALAVGQTKLFWTEPAGGSVAFADKTPPTADGGPRAVLADSQNGPGDLQVYKDDVYWQNQDGIVKCPQSGCSKSGPVMVVSASTITSYAITDQCIFYTKYDAQTVNVIAR